MREGYIFTAMNVAFLGLGTMGAPMADRIRKKFPLTVWNRTVERAAPFQPDVAATPAEAAARADLVISMLSDPAALDEVWRSALEGLRPGTLAIDMSTVDPATVRALADRVTQKGARFIDAPVSGTRKPAVEGTLLIMAGGAIEDVERARPVLATMGRVLHVGEVGQGMATKLVLNGLGAHMLTGFCAMMTLGVRQGLDPRKLLEVITSGAFSSPLYATKGPRIFARDFTADFTLSLMLKDQELVLQTAKELGYPMPTLAAIRDVLIEAVKAGLGEGDLSGLVRLFEAWAGVEVS
jgi:3-hydroxyisobutyrate dehydrogenase-like beta-hydroxyacid dehydrogenase